jgi:hypothetical protein
MTQQINYHPYPTYVCETVSQGAPPLTRKGAGHLYLFDEKHLWDGVAFLRDCKDDKAAWVLQEFIEIMKINVVNRQEELDKFIDLFLEEEPHPCSSVEYSGRREMFYTVLMLLSINADKNKTITIFAIAIHHQIFQRYAHNFMELFLHPDQKKFLRDSYAYIQKNELLAQLPTSICHMDPTYIAELKQNLHLVN